MLHRALASVMAGNVTVQHISSQMVKRVALRLTNVKFQLRYDFS